MQGLIQFMTQTVPDWISNVFRILATTTGWRDILDILLVAYIIYEGIMLLRQTRASQLVRGILVVLMAYLLALAINLKTITFLMRELLQFGLLAVVVLFQPELRHALEQVGRSRFALPFLRPDAAGREVWREAVLTLCDSAEAMAKNHTGALLVVAQQTPLTDIVQTGTRIDAKLTGELLETIFYEGSPLHDGAVIIQEGRVAAAGCLLPVSQNNAISKDMGTRHRAALGMSEISDALIVVVSEETGIVSLAQNGVILRRLDRANLYRILENALVPKEEETEKPKGMLRRLFKR